MKKKPRTYLLDQQTIEDIEWLSAMRKQKLSTIVEEAVAIMVREATNG